MTKIKYIARELRSALWIKPAIMGMAAVSWVCIAYFFGGWIPEDMVVEIKAETLINLLGIMASTMLTVATFSVTAMVSAYFAVSTTATPRATRIVMEDKSTQNSLTSFLAAFIYSIIALVAISVAPYYEPGGRFLLFTGYSLMIVWVLVSFVRWVDRVSKLGRTGDTLNRVEEACRETFSSSDAMGTLGANKTGTTEHNGTMINPDIIGYIQNIDMESLDGIAAELDTKIRIIRRHGAFIDPRESVAVVLDRESLEDETIARIRGSFQIGDGRRVGSDPRFGMILLAEIADRALSPAVNDPGTAIAVLSIQLRLLETWSEQISKSPEVTYKNLEADPLDPEDLLDDAFTAISRDAAGMFEVGSRLQKTFRVLTRRENKQLATAARRHSRLALEQAEKSLSTESHKEILRKLSDNVMAGEES